MLNLQLESKLKVWHYKNLENKEGRREGGWRMQAGGGKNGKYYHILKSMWWNAWNLLSLWNNIIFLKYKIDLFQYVQKLYNFWKLKSILLHEQLIMKKKTQFCQNDNISNEMAKESLRGKFTLIRGYIKKLKSHQINNLKVCLKMHCFEKEQTQLRFLQPTTRRKETLKIPKFK